jgi:hypothetical protein
MRRCKPVASNTSPNRWSSWRTLCFTSSQNGVLLNVSLRGPPKWNSEGAKLGLMEVEGEQKQGAVFCGSSHGQRLLGEWRNLVSGILEWCHNQFQSDMCRHWRSLNNEIEGFGQTGRWKKSSGFLQTRFSTLRLIFLAPGRMQSTLRRRVLRPVG